MIPQLWTGRRHLFHISLPLLRCSLIRPVLPVPVSFRRTVEPPGTGYRLVTEDCSTYSRLGPGTGQVHRAG